MDDVCDVLFSGVEGFHQVSLHRLPKIDNSQAHKTILRGGFTGSWIILLYFSKLTPTSEDG